MEKLISYKTVKLAQQKGIDFRSKDFKGFTSLQRAGTYHAYVTQDTLRTYLRNIHKIDISIEPIWGDVIQTKTHYIPWVYYKAGEEGEDDEEQYFNTYEEALEVALVEALNIIQIIKK